MTLKSPLSRTRFAVLVLTAITLVYAATTPPAAAQQTDPRGLGLDRNKRPAKQLPAPVAELPGKSKRWALVIGVDQYKDAQISTLKGASNDARTLADALVRYAGFPADQVILLATGEPEERQPTRVNILRRLSNLASVVPKDGLLLVSFAGHGMERGGQAYLLPADAQISDDVTFLEETGVSVSRMRERIKGTGVQQVIVLLDACRNDPGGRADAPNLMTPAYKFNFDVHNREVQAFATIYATAVGQRAYEYSEKKQGYFTWALVEGLKGGAANDRGEVTLAQLVSYVQGVVPKRLGIDLGSGKQQRPFAIIEGYKAEQLIVALTASARPASSAAATVAAPSAPLTAAAAADAPSMELTFWDSIKNSAEPADFQAYLERFPNGTFSSLARRRAQPAAAAAVAAPPEADASPAASGRRSPSPGDLVAQAELDYGDRSYAEVIKNTREVLAFQPDNPRANLLLGLSYLKGKRYSNSTPYLSKAVMLGETVQIPIKHHHYLFLVGDAFCEGYLSFGRNVFEFHSTSQGGHDFSVPVSKIYELLLEQMHGGRMRLKVGLQKKEKEDRKTYNFHLTEAYLRKNEQNVVNAHCDSCEQDLQGLFQLVRQLIVLPTGAQEFAPVSSSGAPVGAATTATAPSDAAQNPILQELLLLEQRAFEAAIKGDAAAISPLIADEFTQTQNGKTYNKAQLMAAIKPQPLLRSFSYENVGVNLQGETATLDGIVAVNVQNERAMVTVRQKFTDQFVKRDGRWLFLSSQVTTLKK